MNRLKSEVVGVVLLCAFLSIPAGAKRESAEIAKYIDGDSFVATVGTSEVEVRLIGADTPEAYGKPGTNQKIHASAASKFFKSEITPGVPFEIERLSTDSSKTKDSHDRTLAWVYANGSEYGYALVKNGLAVPYLYCTRDLCGKADGYKNFLKSHKVKEHLEACAQAKKDGVGIWEAKNPLQDIPQEYRRKTLGHGGKTVYVIGDYWTKTYVRKGLKDYTDRTTGIDYCSRVQFDSESDAEDAGFTKDSAR